MHLRDFTEKYLLFRPGSTEYARQLKIAVRLFDQFMERPGSVTDLTRDNLSRFVQWLESQKFRGKRRAPHTIHGRRASLITLAIAASEEKLIEYPRKVRPVVRPEILIEGFDGRQMQSLIRAADVLRGKFQNLPVSRALWAGAFFRLKWESGLRLGDMLALERGWIWPGGVLSFVQHKTGRAHSVTLRAATVTLVDALCAAHGRRLIFPSFGCQTTLNDFFQSVIRKAGLSGTTKYIRRGSSSEVERIQPGMGWRHLGHRSPGLFEKSYRVRRICDQDRPMPPEVG